MQETPRVRSATDSGLRPRGVHDERRLRARPHWSTRSLRLPAMRARRFSRRRSPVPAPEPKFAPNRMHVCSECGVRFVINGGSTTAFPVTSGAEISISLYFHKRVVTSTLHTLALKRVSKTRKPKRRDIDAIAEAVGPTDGGDAAAALQPDAGHDTYLLSPPVLHHVGRWTGFGNSNYRTG